MEFYSPLRYPGGKGKVAGYFKKLFKDNLLYDSIYIEPYAGGASVALSLLFNEYASKIIINDIDASIHSFWSAVLYETDNLCKLIKDTELNIDIWKKQKYIQKEMNHFSKLEIGFSTFFLNRTNRSGILKAGVIGGKDQSGNWKMDARYNKSDLIKRIEKIALHECKIELHNCDAVKLARKLSTKIKNKSLFYFDPPYYVKGKDLYLNYYKHDDHKEIADQISKLNNHNWVVTYDSVDEISKLYTGHRQLKFNLNYSAGPKVKGEELMIFSDGMYISEDALFLM